MPRPDFSLPAVPLPEVLLNRVDDVSTSDMMPGSSSKRYPAWDTPDMPSLGPPDLFRPLFEFLDEGLSLLDGGRSGCGGMTPVAAPIRADLDGGLSVPRVGGGGAAIVESTLMDERRTASVDGRPGRDRDH